jgi:hypothetical protein
MSTQPEQSVNSFPDASVKGRKHLTAYWGVDLGDQPFNHTQVKTHLSEKQHLVALNRVHSTLLYVGKKPDNPHENKYLTLEGKECEVVVSSYGCSDDAMALKVDRISYKNERDEVVELPTHATIQHVTMALKKGIKPVDSFKCFEQGMVSLAEPLIIKGTIKRYLY